jgi:hypothetical protein
VAAGASLLATVMTAPAYADTNTTTATALALIGSDTTDDVMEGLSTLASMTGDLANYKTVPIGRDIDTSANYPGAARAAGSDCATSAPRGSTEGKNGLRASIFGGSYVPLDPVAPVNPGSTNYTECVGVARSSSSSFPGSLPAGASGTIARPAVLKGGTVPKKMTLTFLRDLYTRNGAAGTAACYNITPLIPAFSSGTRSSWASAMGVTDWDFSGTGGAIGTPPAATVQTWGSCVTGGAANPMGVGTAAGNGNPGDRKGGASGTPVQEHQGTFLDGANQTVPFSVGQYIVEGSQVSTDFRGSAVLASVDFTSLTNTVNNATVKHPYSLNGAASASVGFSGPVGNLTREIYNMVPRTLIDPGFTPPAVQVGFRPANAPTSPGPVTAADQARFAQVFVNSTSDICASPATILLYGFAVSPNCGQVTYNP